MQQSKLHRNTNKVKSLFKLLLAISTLTASSTVMSIEKLNEPQEYVNCLESSYEKVKLETNKEEYSAQFYQCFPKSFDKFIAVFGYSNSNSKDAPLANEGISYDYIDYFFKVSISQKNYSDLFRLSLNGYWQLDNVAYFQHLIKDFVMSNREITVAELKRLSPQELKSFWHFYFDGQLPPKQFPRELNYLKTEDAHLHDVAMQVFNYSSRQ